jgi:hypothetical protein
MIIREEEERRSEVVQIGIAREEVGLFHLRWVPVDLKMNVVTTTSPSLTESEGPQQSQITDKKCCLLCFISFGASC